ncbi:uncharacterized [Tachysurus ichikawai]
MALGRGGQAGVNRPSHIFSPGNDAGDLAASGEEKSNGTGYFYEDPDSRGPGRPLELRCRVDHTHTGNPRPSHQSRVSSSFSSKPR